MRKGSVIDNDMEENTFVSKKRLAFIAVVSAAVTAGIILRYASVMLRPQEIHVQPKTTVERGSILDRNGKVLAIQTTLYNIAVTRSSVRDKERFAEALAPATGMPKAEIRKRLDDDSGDFFYLKKRITENEKSLVAEAVRRNSLRGIRLEPVQSRSYPENKLASHVVGFVGNDGFGLTGAEYSFQETLSPPASLSGVSPSGYNIRLTIDGNIQYELEKIAEETRAETQAEAVMMIAASAKTGEILAYISEPSADLNNFPQSTESERSDRPALYAYEPGSVFKIFSVSALIDMGLVKDGDEFLCDGLYTYTAPGGASIQIHCLEHHGWLSPGGVIRFSCNDGTAQMAERAANRDFEGKIRAFGFGEKTGIELPGETAGIVNASATWSLRSKQTIAMGHEISVSALQMVEAATAIANKGQRLKLTLIANVYTHDGEPVYAHTPVPDGNPIKPETAALMLSYMQMTAESGTGARASVGDVPIAVKTGTAQMIDAATGAYSQTDFLSSCLGIFPADDPEIILYLVIVKPLGETYGGRIAAPVISKAANCIIDSLGLGRANATSVRHSGLIFVPSGKPVELGDVMPDLRGVSKKMLTGILARTDLFVTIEGDGYVVEQNPPPGATIEKGTHIELKLE